MLVICCLCNLFIYQEKWKRAHRVPPEIKKVNKVQKNRNIDVFGSRVGTVHVGRSNELDTMRPGATLRTALTGRRKRGFDKKPSRNKVNTPRANLDEIVLKSKRRKLYNDT